VRLSAAGGGMIEEKKGGEKGRAYSFMREEKEEKIEMKAKRRKKKGPISASHRWQENGTPKRERKGG